MAIVQISGELLRERLGWPEDYLIYEVVKRPGVPDVFDVFVEHPSFPEVEEGAWPSAVVDGMWLDGLRREIERFVTDDYIRRVVAQTDKESG